MISLNITLIFGVIVTLLIIMGGFFVLKVSHYEILNEIKDWKKAPKRYERHASMKEKIDAAKGITKKSNTKMAC